MSREEMNDHTEYSTSPTNRPPLAALFLALAGTVCTVHVAVLFLMASNLVASNVCQLLAPLLAVALCASEAHRQRDLYHRRLWAFLIAAFTMWAVAQGYFLQFLLRFHTVPAFPSLADLLWLLFAFPVLLTIVSRRPGSESDWVSWIDAAQAAIFFGVLCVLVFSHSRMVPVWVAYDVQTGALCLAVAWRYFSSGRSSERRFFRILGLYLLMYGGMSSLANRLQQTPSKLADIADLCWSIPPLFFCVLVCVSSSEAELRQSNSLLKETGFRRHLSGWSALGLSLMSLSAAAVLHSHRTLLGFICLIIAMVLFAIRTSARETQLRDARDTLEKAALHDSLTGLPNRAKLLQALHELANDGCGSGFAVVYIDLDRFKAVNDSFGHSFGNQLLLQVAQQIQSVAPAHLLARLGGDEFVLLLPIEDHRDAIVQADAVIGLLQQPIQVEQRSFYITASIGISLGVPRSSGDDLLRDADCAMYVAKAEGRNRVRLFDQAMHDKASEALAFETDLRVAIQEKSLELFYQPIYAAHSTDIVGFEALSRWRHPYRGFVPPDRFIPVAEETGLIMELGKQVLQTACKQVHQWNCSHDSCLYVSVNLSAKQLLDPELVTVVQDALSTGRLPAHLLKLEVTESVLLDECNLACSVLSALRDAGIEIYLDDFGTGYSSLEYLLRLPFDAVKIDRSFVAALHKDPRRLQLVRTIIELSHALGKRTIAEGVEDAAEHDCLDSICCDAYQGYFFSRPLAKELIEDLLCRSMPRLTLHSQGVRPSPKVVNASQGGLLTLD